MDSPRLDHWLKRLWLVNGIALLVLIGAGLVGIAASMWPSRNRSGAVAAMAPATNASAVDPRAVRINLPDAIYGSTSQIVFVHYGKNFAAKGAMNAKTMRYDGSSSVNDEDGASVNVGFLTPGQPGHLLLDKPAFINEVRYPSDKSDSLLHWIEYEIATDDRNKDGHLDDDDQPELWVSDLDGSRLTRVLPPGYRFWRSDPQLDKRTLRIIAFVETVDGRKVEESQQPERTFVYDVPSRQLQPDTALDALVGAAARIVGRRTGQ